MGKYCSENMKATTNGCWSRHHVGKNSDRAVPPVVLFQARRRGGKEHAATVQVVMYIVKRGETARVPTKGLSTPRAVVAAIGTRQATTMQGSTQGASRGSRQSERMRFKMSPTKIIQQSKCCLLRQAKV